MTKSNHTVDYSQKVLEVQNLRQYFKVRAGKTFIIKAVDDVSFDVYSKEVFGLVGESGSGKTTIGRTIIGLYKATGGKVIYRDDVIGYGYESILYDIKKLKKSHRLEISLLSPLNKALYEAKQNYLEKVANNKQEIQAIKAEYAQKIAIAKHTIDEYDRAVQAILREEKLELAEIEKQAFAEKNALEAKKFKTIKLELENYIAAAKLRFRKKMAYLKDAKLNAEAGFDQFNNFLTQLVNEIDFAFDVLSRKIEDNKELQAQVVATNLHNKGIKVITKHENHKLTSDDNKDLIARAVAAFTEHKNKLDSSSLAKKTDSDQEINAALAKNALELKQNTAEVNAKYQLQLSQIALPDKIAVNLDVENINNQKELVIDAKKQELDQIKADYDQEIVQIKASIDSKQPIDEEKKAELESAYNVKLTTLRTELLAAKSATKLQETPEAKKERIAKIKALKERLDIDLAAAQTDEEKEQITEEYKTEVEKIQKSILSYKNVISSMQMIFQDPISSLNPRMTVREIIGEGLIIRGVKDKEEIQQKVFEVLALVGLQSSHADRYPHEFSGGQRQRIGIARALIINPEFIIADEPISALDVSIQAQIINLLNELKKKLGLTILFVAHDLSVVKYFSDRIAVMFKGKIVELATSKELFDNPLHPYTKALLSAIPEPDPDTEKDRQRIMYNPMIHDYSVDKPQMIEIKPGHFIYGNTVEIEGYQKELKQGGK